MKEGFAFRSVFNREVVRSFARDLSDVWPQFDARGFVRMINSRIEDLNFGARSDLITEALERYLPEDYPAAVRILLDALGPELDAPELTGFDGFIIMPQTAFVARNGLDHFDLSMHALCEMTKRFSSEGAVRAFLRRYPDRTLRLFAEWVKDPNPHVRRLVSEGTRPRLPLSTRLREFQKDPSPVLVLLEQLRADPELYVRRSVANNLNDIAKDNPDVVVRTLKRWSREKDAGTQWIIGHALRTLLKQGHPSALALQGFGADAAVRISEITVRPVPIRRGQDAVLQLTLASEGSGAQQLMIDFVVYFVKANGERRPKVFKLAKKRLRAGEEIILTKRLSFRPMTTRTIYPGTHRVEIQINGKIIGGIDFEVE